MSWSEENRPAPAAGRRALLALLLLPLAGCGFHPLYAEQSTLGFDPTLAAIKVEPIRDRIGQILEMQLREELNPRGVDVPQFYTLSVALTVVRADLGIQTDATSVRSQISAQANYTLVEISHNNAVYSDTITAVTAFNVPSDAYAATVEENTARTRAVQDLGREIAIRLALFARQQRDARAADARPRP